MARVACVPIQNVNRIYTDCVYKAIDVGIMSDEGTTSVEIDTNLNIQGNPEAGEAETGATGSIRSGLSL